MIRWSLLYCMIRLLPLIKYLLNTVAKSGESAGMSHSEDRRQKKDEQE